MTDSTETKSIVSDPARQHLKKCILQGISVLIGLMALSTAFAVYAFPGSTGSVNFLQDVVMLAIVGFLLLAINGLGAKSHALQRLGLALWAVAWIGGVAFITRAVHERESLILGLFASSLVVLIASKTNNIASFLSLAIGVLCVVCILNMYWLKSKWHGALVSVIIVIFFTILAVARAYAFSNLHLTHCQFDCCEEGAMTYYNSVFGWLEILSWFTGQN